MSEDQAGTFGELIRQLRRSRERDLNQDDFGDLIGVNGTTVSRWENGHALPDVSLIPRLRDALQLSPVQLRQLIYAYTLRDAHETDELPIATAPSEPGIGEDSIIALLVPRIIHNSFWSLLVGVTEQEAARLGRQLLIYQHWSDIGRLTGALESLVELPRVRGIMLAPIEASGDWHPSEFYDAIEALRSRGRPVIFIDRVVYTPFEMPSVTLDNITAGRMGADILIQQGHTRIAALFAHRDSLVQQERRNGYVQALTTAKPSIVYDESLITFDNGEYDSYEYSAPSAAKSRCIEVIKRHQPTAIFAATCYNAITAVQVIHQLGLKIPRDISLVGFDDVLEFDAVYPPIHRIYFNMQDYPTTAFNKIDRLRRNPKSAIGLSHQHIISVEVKLGKSVSRPRKGPLRFSVPAAT